MITVTYSETSRSGLFPIEITHKEYREIRSLVDMGFKESVYIKLMSKKIGLLEHE